MRILRIRRGFTTNSSGDNEFLPSPDAGRPAAKTAPTPAATRADAAPAPVKAVPAPVKAVPAMPPGAGGPPPARPTTATSVDVPPAPSGGRTWDGLLNGLILGLVAAGVLGLFGADRAVRALLRKRRKNQDDTPTERPE